LATRAVVPGKQIDETMSQYENYLRTLSAAALAHAKRALYSWDAAHFEKGLARAESIYLKDLIHTHDAQEGVRAWMEKRKPIWTGK
jgi:enoyl-CoA hydratase/carnithine racemase